MMRGKFWKRGTAWLLTAAMVFANGSFAALAEELQTESTVQETEKSAPESGETVSGDVTEVPADDAPDVPGDSTDVQETESSGAGDVSQETQGESNASTDLPGTSESEETVGTTEGEESGEGEGQETEQETEQEEEPLILDGAEVIIGEAAPQMMLMTAENNLLTDGSGNENSGNQENELPEISLGSEWGDENGWTWVFEGQAQTFALDEAALAEFGTCEIEWACVSQETQEESTAVVLTVNDGGHSVAVTGVGGHAGENVTLIAGVIADGKQVAVARRDFEVREPVYDYQFPCYGLSQLPGWEFGLEKRFQCYVEDAQHPHGDNMDVEITGIRVENIEADGSAAAVADPIAWDDGNGWNLRSEEYGHAVVTLSYNRLDGTTGEHQFDIWVGGEVYNIELGSESGTDQMLPGASLYLTASVWLDCFDGENHYQGDVSNASVAWSVGEGADAVSFEEDPQDNRRLHVTANPDAAGRSVQIEARVMVPNENNVLEERAYTDFWLHISEGYHQLILGDTENVQNLRPGESADLNAELLFVNAQEPDGTPVTEGVRYRLEWEDWQVAITDNDGKKLNHEEEDGDVGTAPFTVKRLTNEGFHFTVIAEIADADGQYQECTRQSVHSDGQNYDVWFEDLRGGDHSWVFTNEDAVLALNTEKLAGANAQIEWFVGRWDDEAQRPGEAFSAADGYYTVSGDGSSITLHGEKLAEICDPNEESRNFHVEARVSLGGIEVSGEGTGLHMREAYYDYRFPLSEPGEDVLMPGWSTHVDAGIECYAEDAQHPHGAQVYTQVTALEILGEVTYDETGAEIPAKNIVRVEPDGENGWEIYADDYGYADLKMTYVSVRDGAEETMQFRIYVVGDKFSLDLQYPNKIDCMFPGQTMTVETTLFYEWNHGDEERGGETVVDYELKIQQDDAGNPAYDPNFIDVEIIPNEEGKLQNVSITAKEELGGTDLWVAAWHNGEEVCHQRLHVEITDGYVVVEPLELYDDGDQRVNPQIGEELNISDYQPRIVRHTIGADDEVLSGDDYRFRLEYDENVWDSREGEAGGLPILARKTDWGTGIQLIAEERERDGNGDLVYDGESNEVWNEIGRQSYHMDQLEYWTDFGYSYGGRNQSFVFTGSPLTLSLIESEDSPLALPEGCTIAWEVRQYDENGETDLTCVSVAEAPDQKSITLTANAGYEWTGVGVSASVKYGDCEISRTDTVVTVREPYYEYDYPYAGTNKNVMFPGEAIFIPNQMEYEAVTAEHPDGYRDTTEIVDVTLLRQGAWNENGTEVDKDGIVSVEKVSGEGWNLHGEGYGFADLRLSYTSADPSKVEQPETQDFRVFVTDKVYWAEWQYPDDWDFMLPNGEMTIGTKLFCGSLDEDNSFKAEELTDYRLVVGDEAGPWYDPEMLTVEVTDNTALKVSANGRTGGAGIDVGVFVTDSEGQEQEVLSERIFVNISDVYANIAPYALEKDGQSYWPRLAQELNLNDFEFHTTTYWLDENGAAQEKEETAVMYELEYDPNVWDVREGTQGEQFPVLVRSKMWETSVTVIARKEFEDGSIDEIGRRDYWFGEVSPYVTDFAYSYGERMDEPQEGETVRSFVLTDIPLVLTVDTGDVAELPEYEIRWKFWQYDEATESQKEMTAAEATVSEDGRSVSLIGKAGAEGQWIDVQAEIVYREEVIGSTWTHAMVDTCDHNWIIDSEENCVRNSHCEICGAGKSEQIHELAYHAAKAATCTAQGNIAYWSCVHCGRYFLDEAGTQEAEKNQIFLSALGHKLTYHAAKAATCTATGTEEYYSCAQCKKNFDDNKGTKPLTSITTKALGHSFGTNAWKTTTAATVFAPAKQTRTCSRCKKNEVRNYGSKLRATITTTANSLTMKMRQSTTKFMAAGFARGDSLASVVSGNTAIVKVSNVSARGTFKLTAQRKSGSTKLTLRTKAGAVKVVTVKVQKSTVRTTAIAGVAKTAAVQKGKTIVLKPVIAPVTSQESVKYKSSNKKIATVTSKGVIKGVKPGRVKIYVQSGRKKVTCTVTVLGIKNTKLTNVRTSVTIKRRKSYTLRPRRYPANSTDAITYKSSNKRIATVSSSGKIVGKKAGTAIITVTCGSAVAKCVVTVK